MKTFKNNFDLEIKKQIEGREIAPTRDLWTEIQAQAGTNNRSGKSKLNRVLLAACIALLISLGAVLVFDEDPQSDVKITETKKAPSVQQEKAAQEKINTKEIITAEEQKKVAEVKSIPAEIKAEMPVMIKNDLPLIKENPSEIASKIIHAPPAKIIAKSDSVKTQKKKRYVDPSTLLFSVEHKDVIEKTKDGSNVATIDLNTK